MNDTKNKPMKRIVVLLMMCLAVLPVCSAQRGGSPSKPSASPRPAAQVQRQAVPSRTAPQPRTAAYRAQPAAKPAKPTAPDYSRRPSAPTESPTRSPMPDNYRIPDKPNQAPARVGSDKRGYVKHPQPTAKPEGPHSHGHGPTYGEIHHVPHDYHPKPPTHHPFHHGYIQMYYRPNVAWMYDKPIWHNYWRYMHMMSHLEHVVVIANMNTAFRANTLIDYIVSDEMIFSLYRDCYDGNTYFAVTDAMDNTLARVKVSRRYQRLMADDTGIWVLTKRGDSPIYFMFIDGRLYMYKCD